MKPEIHLYLGSSTATEKVNQKYKAGNRYPFMLFIKYNSITEYRNEEALEYLRDLGWQNTVINKSGKLYEPPTKIDFIEPYNSAIRNGSAIVIYNEPIKE